jgi:tetratricopeptide (TPR) repeat protein
MTLIRPNLQKLLAGGLALSLAVALLALVNGSSSPRPSAPGAVPGRSTDARIDFFQDAVRREPRDSRGYGLLGDAYLQKARESGDPGWYARAEGSLERARRLDPRDAGAAAGLAALALSRHEFGQGLRLATEARALAPDSVKPYGALVDAQVELGRYDDAARTLQRMVDLKPSLSSYSRVSYFRELRGDLRGAVQAMRLAASAGGEAAENVAYVQTLLGGLELQRGRLRAASLAFREAAARLPGYPAATAGLARVAAVRGDLGSAIELYRGVVARLPLPEYVIALAEAELAAGRRADARRELDLVEAEQRLLRANGVNTDAELALYEADHGNPSRGTRLARRAYGAAPSVRSADALSWALTRAGRPDEALRLSRRALSTGWRDPLTLYHAGVTASEAGRAVEARRLLARALDPGTALSPYHARRARHALEALR